MTFAQRSPKKGKTQGVSRFRVGEKGEPRGHLSGGVNGRSDRR